MLRLFAVASLLVAVCPAVVLAQDADAEAAARSAAANAVRAWAEDYEHDRLAPRGPLRSEQGLQPRYVAVARAADLLSPRDLTGLTHVDALQKLLFYGENHVDEGIGDAMLAVAAVGLEKALADRDAMTLRDLGHVTLMRVDHRGVWFLLMRAASGEQVPVLGALRRNEDGDAVEPVPVARRVAAIKLLGQKGLPVFRGILEGCLVDLDPRVRLAAVEALELQRKPESLSVLLRCAGTERHPVVSQAVVRALLATLKTARTAAAQGAEPVPREDVERVVATALRQLGQCGWRTDMDLVELCGEFPVKAAIPHLIDLLAPRTSGDDRLVAAINKNASPLLRDRAWTCLRGMTGAIFTAEQHQQWSQFWQQEQDRITVPEHLPVAAAGNATRSAFFGIPVTGRDIAFVIDTSGSMDEAFGTTATERGRGRAGERANTRLSAAKEQLLLAVQAMDPQSHYQLLTFDGEAHLWSKQPVPPSPQATRSLTELLSHLKAHGGTNVYDGLAQAMALEKVRYGETGTQQIDELFLLSDGEPTMGAVRDPEEILRLVREANKYLKVRINTVFAGAGTGADFLRRLASENGGVFVQR